MQIKEVMSSAPTYIKPSTTLKNAASQMATLNVGFLPVGDPDKNKLVGTVTDRDIVIRGVAKDKDIDITPVQEVMTDKVLYCYENDSVEDAADSMKKQRVRRLVVLDKKKDLVGVVSLGDLATHIHNDKLTGEILESVSEKKG